jgi:membrane protein DedA with SNARE-associated domain
MPAADPPIPSHDPALLRQTFAIIAAIAGLTTVRVLLLLGVAGAFYLAVQANNLQTASALYVLIAYAVLIVLPLVGLDWISRRSLS